MRFILHVKHRANSEKTRDSKVDFLPAGRDFPRPIRLLLAIVLATSLFACQTRQTAQEHAPAEQEVADWSAAQGLEKATLEEVAEASKFETAFVSGKAASTDGILALIFRPGHLKAASTGYTTTSRYDLIERGSGRTLISLPSTFSIEHDESFDAKQRAWILPDHRVLLHETWLDGLVYHEILALISRDASGTWRVRYLAPPEFHGIPGMREHGAWPFGLLGDQLLFDPVGSGSVYKKKLDEIPTAKDPLPFEVG